MPEPPKKRQPEIKTPRFITATQLCIYLCTNLITGEKKNSGSSEEAE